MSSKSNNSNFITGSLEFQIIDDNSSLITHQTSYGKYMLEVFSFTNENIEEIKKLKEDMESLPPNAK